MSFSDQFFNEVIDIATRLDKSSVERLTDALLEVRKRSGRVFVLGVGGSAGNASHMVNDLRKLAHIETYAPTDNVPELTARTNDEGFETVFEEYLKISKFGIDDAVFILSVGGGDEQKRVSINIVNAVRYAKDNGGKVLGIVGRKQGYTANNADVVVVVPEVEPSRITPHSEAFQAVVWHCIVSHPKLQMTSTKW